MTEKLMCPVPNFGGENDETPNQLGRVLCIKEKCQLWEKEKILRPFHQRSCDRERGHMEKTKMFSSERMGGVKEVWIRDNPDAECNCHCIKTEYHEYCGLKRGW